MNNEQDSRRSKTNNKKRRRLKKSVRQFLFIAIPLIFIIVVGSVIMNQMSSKEAAVGAVEGEKTNQTENKDPSQSNSEEKESEKPTTSERNKYNGKCSWRLYNWYR